MFREQNKVLDCTIRDGGLINQQQLAYANTIEAS